jgi:polyisoprenoid-binding protein YceI
MRPRAILSLTVAAFVALMVLWLVFIPVPPVQAAHTAVGPAKACGTPISTTGLQPYTIVPAQTTVSYTVHENLIVRGLPNNIVVGKTHSVQGGFAMTTAPTPRLTGVHLVIDLTTLQTDSAQRDNFVRKRWLDSDHYPTATFDSTCITGLPATYSLGQPIMFQMIGNLTVHGVTNQETFAVHGMLTSNTVTGMASTEVYMTDFGLTVPNLANFVIAQNNVVLAIAFTASPAA